MPISSPSWTRLLLLLCVFPVSDLYAASFDCKKAASDVEKKICANHELSDLDRKLGNAYREILGLAMWDKDPNDLRAGQLDWLKRRDQCFAHVSNCVNDDDVADGYRDRIQQLEERASRIECSGGTTSEEEAQCMTAKAQATERALGALIVRLKAELVEPNRELAAQKSWENYRDKECKSQATVNGFAGAEESANCYADHAAARLEELKRHLCEDNGCPAKRRWSPTTPFK